MLKFLPKIRSGLIAEKVAILYLKFKNYIIWETNWVTSHGREVDIICRKGRSLIFVEVKSRKVGIEIYDSFQHVPEEQVFVGEQFDEKKKNRIEQLATEYFQSKTIRIKRERVKSYRLDLVTVEFIPWIDTIRTHGLIPGIKAIFSQSVLGIKLNHFKDV